MIKSVDIKIDKVLEMASNRASGQRENEKFKGAMDKARKNRNEKGDNDLLSDKKDEKIQEKPKTEFKKETEKTAKTPEDKTEIKTEESNVSEETKVEILTDIKNIMEEIMKLLRTLDNNVSVEGLDEKNQAKISELLSQLETMVGKVSEDNLKAMNSDINIIKDLMGNSELKGDQFKSVLQNIEDRVNTILLQNDENSGKNHMLDGSFNQKDTESGEDESKEMDTLNSILNSDKKSVLGTKNTFFNKLSSLNKGTNLPPVRANFAAHDVVKSIRFMSQNDMKELTLKVVPRNLGEIAIKLTVDAGVMKAVITAVNKDTASLLQNNSMLIQEKLAENGMKSDSIEVSIAHEDTTFHKESNGEGNFRDEYRGNSSKSSDGEVEGEDENEEVELDYSINAMV